MNPTTKPTQAQVELARHHMIEQQIRPWGVLQPRLLQCLNDIHREDFMPDRYKGGLLAFADEQLPLGDAPSEQMLCPKVQARLVQDLALVDSDQVLQIGAGTGYMTALMARLSRHVMALERNPQLAQSAAQNLSHAVVANADVCVADGALVEQIQGTFDAIVLCGSVQDVPQALIHKLKPAGRLVAIVGEAQDPVMRVHQIVRDGSTDAVRLQTHQAWDTVVPALVGFASRSTFVF